MDREFYALQNPVGCLLAYLLDLRIDDSDSKKLQIVSWMINQSPDMALTAENIYSELEHTFEFSIDFLDKLFIKLGWQTHYILPIFKEKLYELERAGLIEKNGKSYSITNLGIELFIKGHYKKYFETLSEIADYWKDRNVKLYRENEKGIGSGFFIDSHKIATCKHVYDDLKDNLKIEDEIGNVYSVRGIKYHPNSKVDLVIIITNEEYSRTPFILGDNVKLVEKVLVFGYPPVPLTTKPFLICNLGEISSIVDNYFEQVDYLILSCIVKPGNSGGPVIDKYGKVVGIATQNIMEQVTIGDMKINEPIDWIKSMGYSSALPVRYLKEIINLL